MRALMAILVLLAAPAAASAATPTVDALKPCYRSVSKASRESVPVTGRGFTPGEQVTVSVDNEVAATATANEDGNVIGAVSAPYQARGERPFWVTLTEVGLPENTATVQSRVAALVAWLKPASAKPSRRVRFLGRGFTDDTLVYGHYVRAGKLRKTVVLGAPEGPCGRLDVRRRQIPIHKPATGRWTLQVDNLPDYGPHPRTVFVRVPITVKRIIATGTR